MAATRLATSPLRSVSLYLAEAALQAASEQVEQQTAACACPRPPPNPRSRQEWSTIKKLRKKQSRGVPLTASEQGILDQLNRELERALTPLAGLLSRQRPRKRPVDRETREARQVLAEARARIEDAMVAEAVAEDMEWAKLELEARAAAAKEAALVAERIRLESIMIAEAKAADEELARAEAQRRAAAAAQLAEEQRAAAELKAAEEAFAAAQAAMEAEAELERERLAEAKAKKAAAKAAKEAAKSQKEKEAREEAAHSAKMRKLRRQMSSPKR